MAYTWNSETDSFGAPAASSLSEIRDERGWSQQELLTELANRKRFLEYLQANGIDDYQRFYCARHPRDDTADEIGR